MFKSKKVQSVKRFMLWKGSKESTGPLMVGGFQEVSEVERLFQQLWNIPQHPTYPRPVATNIKQAEQKIRVHKLVLVAAAKETSGVECLGVEFALTTDSLVTEISMAGRGAPKGRGQGACGNQENWQEQQQMEFVQGPFGYPLPFFMLGAMPPPWAFNGPFQ
jgi:hypothetical protein